MKNLCLSCVSFLSLMIVLCNFPIAYAANDTYQSILKEMENEKGYFYTWSLKDKANFYEQHVYDSDSSGMRRAAPSSQAISENKAIQTVRNVIIEKFSIEANALDSLICERNYFKGNMPGSRQQTEMYLIRYLEGNPQKPDALRSVYQVSIDAYSGEVLSILAQ